MIVITTRTRRNPKRYEIVDGERKAWELSKCIRQFGKLNSAVTANLEFIIGLRNKIEHRHIDELTIGALVFGECQSLLYNYENVLIELFGQEYAVNENLAYSLQFSTMRTAEQKKSVKSYQSREATRIKEYVKNYREDLPEDVFLSQEFSIKLIQIPKVSNTSRNDLAIEFVNWKDLSDEERAAYEKLEVLVKEKREVHGVANLGRVKPGSILKEVEEKTGIKLNHNDHRCLYYVFSVRPITEEHLPTDQTNDKYCVYDTVHEDYLYAPAWADFLVAVLSSGQLTMEVVKENFKNRTKLLFVDFEPAAKKAAA
ncbi:MAG: DUF3644 domain-containing protein [Pyrinomonadaceae bacterium]